MCASEAKRKKTDGWTDMGLISTSKEELNSVFMDGSKYLSFSGTDFWDERTDFKTIQIPLQRSKQCESRLCNEIFFSETLPVHGALEIRPCKTLSLIFKMSNQIAEIFLQFQHEPVNKRNEFSCKAECPS